MIFAAFTNLYELHETSYLGHAYQACFEESDQELRI